MAARARQVMRCVVGGDFKHSDLAKYHLNLQSGVYACKPVLKRSEMQDICGRVREQHGTEESSSYKLMDLSMLPSDLKDHIGEHNIFKVEWMFKGRYASTISRRYAENIMSDVAVIDTARIYKIPPKLVDTCGLNAYDIAYKLWCGSIENPGRCVSYTGSGYWKSDKKVWYTTVRTMSYVVNTDYIITATTIGRGKV